MTDLFSKFDPLIRMREDLLATGVKDPFGLVMEKVLSPTHLRGKATYPCGGGISLCQSIVLPSLAHSSAQTFATSSGTGLGGSRTTSTLKPISPSAHLLPLATSAGADALGLRDQVGDLDVGKRFDAVWLSPPPGTPLAIGLRHADGPSDALAKAFALATPHDLQGVWVDGERVKG